MRSLLVLIGLCLADAAYAQADGGLNDPNRFTLGGGAAHPAVTGMWAQICAVLPFCDVGAGAFMLFASKIAAFVLAVTGVLAVTVLLYAAIKIIASQGNEEGVNEAKKIATWALGGVILAITGQAVVQYFINVVVPQAVGS